MERRKILLGSGAALTTALAGCFGSESSNDDGGSDNGNESNADDGSGNSSDGDSENTGNSDSEESDGTNGNDETGSNDIPGFDGSKLDLKSDAVTITSIERTDDTVEVVATSDITDFEKLYAELGRLADAHKSAIVDLETFAAEITSIEWVVDHDKKKVVSFTVKTEWLVSYKNGELSAEAFLEKVKSTAE